MDIDTLVNKKDGAGLLSMALEKNYAAGVAFANLVFSSKYKGETVDKDGKALTQKYAKEKAIEDAIEVLLLGAENNYLDAIIRIADMHFFGVMEAGPFGSKLVLCSFESATPFYDKVVTHSDATSDMVGMAEFRLGTLCKFLTSPIEPENMEKAFAHWKKARLQTGEGCILAAAAIAEYEYNERKNYATSIPLLESIYKEHRGSALWLSLAYKHGHGVKKDENKSAELYLLWDPDSRKKKK